MSKMRRFVACFAICASAMVPGLAQAQDQDQDVVIQGVPRDVAWKFVRYDDLNLTSPAGISRLYGRIHRAAELLCVDNRVRDLGREMEGDRCKAIALDNARFGVDRAIALQQARYSEYSSGAYAER